MPPLLRGLALITLVVQSAVVVAQSSTATFNRRFGSCEAQSDPLTRSRCFEQLAKDLIDELERRVSAPSQISSNSLPFQSQREANKYETFVQQAKANLVKDFKDPSSVQWRSLFVSDGLALALCGEVNAKNSYGAYIGFQRFVATAEPWRKESTPAKIDAWWEGYCRRELAKVE